MKKLRLLLIPICIFSAAWMFYTYYSHKRFMNDIEKLSPPSKQSINTSETPTVSKDTESIVDNASTTSTQSTQIIVDKETLEDSPIMDTENIAKKREIHTQERPLITDHIEFQRLRTNPKYWLDGDPNVSVETSDEMDPEFRELIRKNGLKVSFTDLDIETQDKIISNMIKIDETLKLMQSESYPEDSNVNVQHSEDVRLNEDGTVSFISETVRSPKQ